MLSDRMGSVEQDVMLFYYTCNKLQCNPQEQCNNKIWVYETYRGCFFCMSKRHFSTSGSVVIFQFVHCLVCIVLLYITRRPYKVNWPLRYPHTLHGVPIDTIEGKIYSSCDHFSDAVILTGGNKLVFFTITSFMDTVFFYFHRPCAPPWRLLTERTRRGWGAATGSAGQKVSGARLWVWACTRAREPVKIPTH